MKNQKTFFAAHNGCAARIVRLIENIFPFDQMVVKRQCNNRDEKIKIFLMEQCGECDFVKNCLRK